MAARFTEAADFMERVGSMAAVDSTEVALILEHSAASIMEEIREASLRAGGRASVEVFTEAEVFTAVAAVTGNWFHLP